MSSQILVLRNSLQKPHIVISCQKGWCLKFYSGSTAPEMNFLIKNFSVNVTKFTKNCSLVTFNEEILNGKIHFSRSVICSTSKIVDGPLQD